MAATKRKRKKIEVKSGGRNNRKLLGLANTERETTDEHRYHLHCSR